MTGTAMHPTDEQKAILSSHGNIKINAVAGSGKTTTLVEIAKRQKPAARILYLAFNRSVRLEAQRRFGQCGLPQVEVQTAHSLAWYHVMRGREHQVSKGYKAHDLVDLLKIRPVGRDSLSPHILASHILKCATLFCNSPTRKVQEAAYFDTVGEENAREFVARYYENIQQGARLFLTMMDRADIAMTHDFYLKKFQLASPKLTYDVILFDEGQDASPVMLDVFMAQAARKVIVGDVHQQIYGWRHAINALRQVGFAAYPLTTSFRFNDHVARLAMECLRWKRHLDADTPVMIRGVGKNGRVATRATIARTNLALLKSAIAAAQHGHAIKKLYFEGNISSYTYAAEGASIYDVLNLYLGKRDRIRDPLIAAMRAFADLEEYADTSEDLEMRMLIQIVKEYGADIPRLLKRITQMHVDDARRGEADMVFSTVHRCKGMEYDAVTLTDDFMNESRIVKLIEKQKEEPVDRGRLAEEINLAYVAVTRSRNFLTFPREMFPGIDDTAFALPARGRARARAPVVATRFLEKRGPAPGHAGMRWTLDMDEELMNAFRSGIAVPKIARLFERNPGAIHARLKKLGMTEDL
jgi:F-box protein, helicase, 18